MPMAERLLQGDVRRRAGRVRAVPVLLTAESTPRRQDGFRGSGRPRPEFGIRILDEELERFQAVGDVLDYIRQARVAA
jgi:hypothetical protein